MVESSNFLGVIINSSLDWSDHISLVNRKVSKSIGILKCVKNKLSADTWRSLYFALVHPCYEYANIVWAVRNTVVLQKLFITQKKGSSYNNQFTMECSSYPLFRKKHAYLQFRNYIRCRWHVSCLKWIKVLCLHTFQLFF